jgi:carbon-monoxide dehydrogenase small subunit
MWEIALGVTSQVTSSEKGHKEIAMKLPVKVEVNGTTYEEEVDARQLLVHFLRDRLGLTGTHVGCDTSQCGACTIIMDGQAVKSCTVLAVQANGSSLRTVEGLSHDGELHPIQKGFWDKHGLQCGYCTPGMMMTALHILERNPNPSNEDIRRDLEGVLCRCTGYQNIVQAVQQAAAEMRGAPAAH